MSKIWLADDSDVFLHDFENALKSAGYTKDKGYSIRKFNRPKDVLEALDTSVPDILVTDYDMNIMSLTGLKLAMKIRESNHKFPIILTSSDSLGTIREHYKDDYPDGQLQIGVAGAAVDSFIPKNSEVVEQVVLEVKKQLGIRQRQQS